MTYSMVMDMHAASKKLYTSNTTIMVINDSASCVGDDGAVRFAVITIRSVYSEMMFCVCAPIE